MQKNPVITWQVTDWRKSWFNNLKCDIVESWKVIVVKTKLVELEISFMDVDVCELVRKVFEFESIVVDKFIF